jgi:hypothetical protein
MVGAVQTETPTREPLGGTSGQVPALSWRERAEVCRILAKTLDWDRFRNAGERCWEAVESNAAYEAWLIGWPPGGRVQLHDHGPSSGSVLVLEGALNELTPYLRSNGALRLERRRYASGSLLAFDAGHLHDLINQGDAPAVSLHVYSPRLESMTYFDLSSRGIVERETLRPVEERWDRHLP